MSQTQRLVLTGEIEVAGTDLGLLDLLQLRPLVARLEGGVELGVHVEMVLHHALAAAGDEHELLDSGLARLVDGGLETRAEAGNREYGFANRGMLHYDPLITQKTYRTQSSRSRLAGRSRRGA